MTNTRDGAGPELSGPSRIVIYAHKVGHFGGQESAIASLVSRAHTRNIPVHIVAFTTSPSVERIASVTKIHQPHGPFAIRFIWYWISSAIKFRPEESDVRISCGAITHRRVDAAWMHYWHRDALARTGWVTSMTWNFPRLISRSSARLLALAAEFWVLRRPFTPRLIAVSNSQLRALTATYPTALVSFLPNPVKTANELDTGPKGTDCSETTAPTILFLGGDWNRKGLNLIASAASRSASRHHSIINLRVVGPGTNRQISRLSRLPGLDVSWSPWSAKIDDELRSSSLFALASNYETFSMAGHEALAMGVPVVTTDVHGLADSVRRTHLGRVVQRSADSFETAFDDLLFEKGDARASAANAILVTRECFGPAAIESFQDHLLMQLGFSDKIHPRDEMLLDPIDDKLSLSVIIPSVRRTDALQKAINSVHSTKTESVRGGSIEILVVARADDTKTVILAESLGCKVVQVDRPGQAFAMYQGSRAATGDIVAFMDDDAEVTYNWADALLTRYCLDPCVVGVGGRDNLPAPPLKNVPQAKIGRISRIGRVYGGHDQALGAVRVVDHLKGVNCSFRRRALLNTDIQLRVEGSGAQARNEFCLSLSVSGPGSMLVLDPSVQVNHNPVPRLPGDGREAASKAYETAFNETLGFELTRYRSFRTHRLYSLLAGYRTAPGLLRILRGAPVQSVGNAIAGSFSSFFRVKRSRKEPSPVHVP